jgi:hypothetical protein
MADRGARAVQIASGQGCLGFDQGAESKEGIEGVSKMCSPRAEIDGDGRNRRGANDRRRLQLDLHGRNSGEHQEMRMADRWASRRGHPCGGACLLQWRRSQAAGRGGGDLSLRVPSAAAQGREEVAERCTRARRSSRWSPYIATRICHARHGCRSVGMPDSGGVPAAHGAALRWAPWRAWAGPRRLVDRAGGLERMGWSGLRT